MFSIITPINSIPATFGMVVDAVNSNSYRSFEWLFILNGDQISESDIRSFGPKNARYLWSDPGVSKARNVGLSDSASDFVLFLDADDLLSPTYLSEMRDFIERCAGYDCYSGRGVKFSLGPDMSPRFSSSANLIFREEPLDELDIAMNRIGPPSGVVVRLSCAPRFDESLTIFEDLDFYLRCSGKGLRFVASDSVKYGYFVEGSVRERELKFGRERIKRADEIISDKAKEYGLNWRARIVLRLLRSCLIARYRGSKIGSLGFLALLSLTAPQYLWALIGKRLTVEQSL